MPEIKPVFVDDLLEGETWLVTGGGSGIGEATALLAAQLGANLVIAGRKADRLAPVAEAIVAAGGQCLTRSCDIREVDQVEALVDAALERFSGIDALINNAGGQFPSPAIDLSKNGWDAVIRNNLSGTWYMTQAVAKKAMIPRHRGAIVNVIANIFRGFPGMAHTGAARAGVDNLTKTLAIEWASSDVRVNAVAPGIIRTSGIEQYPPELIAGSERRIPVQRMGSAQEVADAIVFLGSRAASYVTGETLYIDGGARLWGDLWPIPARDGASG